MYGHLELIASTSRNPTISSTQFYGIMYVFLAILEKWHASGLVSMLKTGYTQSSAACFDDRMSFRRREKGCYS